MNEKFVEQALRVLRERQPAAALAEEVSLLLQAWTEVTDWQPEHPELHVQSGTETEGGFAVLPAVAAKCIESPVRVLNYARALYQAVLDQRQACPARPARVIYPGCGPYATLVALVAAVFSAEEIQITLVDIHEESIRSARTLMERHGLTDRIAGFEVADILQLPVQDIAPDIGIMEILVAGLESEGQVAITRHLLTQMPTMEMIPQRINLELRLVDPAKEFSATQTGSDSDKGINLGIVMCLDAERVKQWESLETGLLPCHRVAFPAADFSGYSPLLFTELELYGEHRLAFYEDGITSPVYFDIHLYEVAGRTVQFNYRTGLRPGLVFERMPEQSVTEVIRVRQEGA